MRPTALVVIDQALQLLLRAISPHVLGLQHVSVRPQVVIAGNAGDAADECADLGRGLRLREAPNVVTGA